MLIESNWKNIDTVKCNKKENIMTKTGKKWPKNK